MATTANATTRTLQTNPRGTLLPRWVAHQPPACSIIRVRVHYPPKGIINRSPVTTRPVNSVWTYIPNSRIPNLHFTTRDTFLHSFYQAIELVHRIQTHLILQLRFQVLGTTSAPKVDHVHITAITRRRLHNLAANPRTPFRGRTACQHSQRYHQRSQS